MKRISIVVGIAVTLTVPLAAAPFFHFSSVSGSADPAWQLDWTGTRWELSFFASRSVVDWADPADGVLLGDHVQLPVMALESVTDLGWALEGSLSPVSGPLAVISDRGAGTVPASTTVFTADIGVNRLRVFETTGETYALRDDNLDVLFLNSHYPSPVLTSFAALDASKWGILHLSLTLSSAADLSDLLKSHEGSATGTLSGVVSGTVPAPGALLLAVLGTTLIGWLRRRRCV